MIQFITLSRDDAPKLRENLALTFGGKPGLSRGYALTVMDGNSLDLFQGYDQGWMGDECRSTYLCFVHDDVELLCHPRLFDPLIELLKKPFTGFIGAAGAVTMPEDACWWRQDHQNLRGMVAHPQANSRFGIGFNVWPWGQAQFGSAAVLDGCILMCNTKTMKRLGGFQDGGYRGFHFYDMVITARATLSGLTNYVAPLPLLHNSVGVPNQNWEENRLRFIEEFRPHLPLTLHSRW